FFSAFCQLTITSQQQWNDLINGDIPDPRNVTVSRIDNFSLNNADITNPKLTSFRNLDFVNLNFSNLL
ncbi:MAG: hypothetical protein AAFP20_24985, partial [Cyanobacteria bacterium J06614_10]